MFIRFQNKKKFRNFSFHKISKFNMEDFCVSHNYTQRQSDWLIVRK